MANLPVVLLQQAAFLNEDICTCQLSQFMCKGIARQAHREGHRVSAVKWGGGGGRTDGRTDTKRTTC